MSSSSLSLRLVATDCFLTLSVFATAVCELSVPPLPSLVSAVRSSSSSTPPRREIVRENILFRIQTIRLLLLFCKCCRWCKTTSFVSNNVAAAVESVCCIASVSSFVVFTSPPPRTPKADLDDNEEGDDACRYCRSSHENATAASAASVADGRRPPLLLSDDTDRITMQQYVNIIIDDEGVCNRLVLWEAPLLVHRSGRWRW
mmetsp:Transcript_14460/g.31145  ORF Transcript_14460/g.31145 Transcript_14460/m.31145 type:complete len:202 (-) Transcript_14460:179-784(-)